MKRPRTTALERRVNTIAASVTGAHERMSTLENAFYASGSTPSADKSKEVAALVGLWIDRQKAEGATTVDLKRVDDIRTGIELALS